MNKLTLSMIGAAVLLLPSVPAHAKGAVGHISAGPSATVAHAPGATHVPITTGTSLAAGKSDSNIKPSQVHGFDPTAPGANVGSAGSKQLQSRGIVVGIGNSLGSLSVLSGKGLGDGGRGRVVGMSKQLSQTGTSSGIKAGKQATGSNSSGKTHSPVVLGVSRAPKTGDVCIWGAGANGSCH